LFVVVTIQAQIHAPDMDVHGFVKAYLDALAAHAHQRICAIAQGSPVSNKQVRLPICLHDPQGFA